MKTIDEISLAALEPEKTARLFALHEDIFADICARWTSPSWISSAAAVDTATVVSGLARILPFAPYLSVFLEKFMQDQPLSITPAASSTSLTRALLAIWRLNSFSMAYGTLATASDVQGLFGHENRAVRYLAIRIFCQILHAADRKMEALIEEHVGTDEPISGDFDGRELDYALLTLAEHGRRTAMAENRRQIATKANGSHGSLMPEQQLTARVAVYGKTLLPRPLGPPSTPSCVIVTPTAARNLEKLAKVLQKAGPVLLHGLPGSGKTLLIHELARELGKQPDMVTLHLNDQTDAKMLIGLYSTGSRPGSFEWRPGVLTKAVREGRWVLVEDIDRAPAEVVSSLLPLVERGELLIPSRSETIKAASGFRLVATVRTSKGMKGEKTIPHLLGQRFWNMVDVEAMPETELRAMIQGTFPILAKLTPQILSIYKRVCRAISMPSMVAAGRGMLRQMTLRDLLRLCRRLKDLVHSTDSLETVSERTKERILMEAADCFLGHLPDGPVRAKLLVEIGKELNWSEKVMRHFLAEYKPRRREAGTSFIVGRATLQKHGSLASRPRRLAGRAFADTRQSMRLLEQLTRSAQMREPVLLVGETGIGKTTAVQHLAHTLGRKLVAINLSQQSEAGDLLGGFKPVKTFSLSMPLRDEFDDLFREARLHKKNEDFLAAIGKCFAKRQWTKLYKLWKRGHEVYEEVLQNEVNQAREEEPPEEPPTKRQKKFSQTRLDRLTAIKSRWDEFANKLEQFKMQIAHGSASMAFSFVESHLVKAARNGDWVLLDEINLASSDTLESIADLLDDSPSLLLSEKGEIERIKAHADFRIFGAMNPATDVGKRDLPLGIRSRFTEIYVNSPDRERQDLLEIVKAYIAHDDMAAGDMADLYLETKKLADQKSIVDGSNDVPHFSLRTLSRVLTYALGIAKYYGLRRALYEGFCMGFLTLLDRNSEQSVEPLIRRHLFKTEARRKELLSRNPKRPDDGRQYVLFQSKTFQSMAGRSTAGKSKVDKSSMVEHKKIEERKYWLLQGNHDRTEDEKYIMTTSVKRNLLNLVRATSNAATNGGGFPVLIQGPTSSGKTSMIEYLANYSGNKFVRINNHEHTDLQEYLGTYMSGSDGQLHFQDGMLVQAMRHGHWIVLDELNLAPTDVLEALNRLLDDNRELLIPETQEIIRPHENFRLFATQNPPGLYGGRKVLSRAFRNRFLELHFDDIPKDELEYILRMRATNTSPSDCERIVKVYMELSLLRQKKGRYQQNDSFATLRDLFRWALRDADSRHEIAANGFMLLGERVRNEDERNEIRTIIEKVFKSGDLDTKNLYAKSSPALRNVGENNSQGVIWTQGMRRLYILVSQAIRNCEPVLLVGETGCGKTSICQVLAEMLGKKLHIVNAHQNMETGDVIGSQRPIRNRAAVLHELRDSVQAALELLGQDASGSVEDLLQKLRQIPSDQMMGLPVELCESISTAEARSKALFEWCDGSLVHAMKTGEFFLLDEISLADDSVLERLNSVLESHRTLFLAEKGMGDPVVKAHETFQFFATMNPGGDFGKKELSPALRNRFTEIWVPPLAGSEDMLEIVFSKLHVNLRALAQPIVEFSTWFGDRFRSASSTAFSVREVLVWVKFINHVDEFDLNRRLEAIVHGAAAVFIDSLGANPSGLVTIDSPIEGDRQLCLHHLGRVFDFDACAIYEKKPALSFQKGTISVGSFELPRDEGKAVHNAEFFVPDTTQLNTLRVVRALGMEKPILLEGSPGVGKTTLVAALAEACGRPLTRINLSDQTDLMDLFGTDIPVEGAEAGNFAWRDAPFLRAMQRGEWVLLDEMNLASQSVLEGLNACLDHRGQVYISELGQYFTRHKEFRLFAAQNPHHQGGGRKGLPSSFVNRFVVVYVDTFKDDDLRRIAELRWPDAPSETIGNMIRFITALERKVSQDRAFGSQGSPWEFNLRDLLRWLQLVGSQDALLRTAEVDDFLDMIVRQRFRTPRDRNEVTKLFTEIFGRPPRSHSLYHDITSSYSQIGLAVMARQNVTSQPVGMLNIDFKPLLSELESLMICVERRIPVILSGPPGSGKSVLIQHLASLAGKQLVTFPLNADVDTMDLVGGFEQSDPLREVNKSLHELSTVLQDTVLSAIPQPSPEAALQVLAMLTRTPSEEHYGAVLAAAVALHGHVAPDSDLYAVLTRAVETLRKPRVVSNPRFEWLDGVILRALAAGDWLVLDNANLCSASVLDRLNSLLEPAGLVSVNEHCDATGEPRIVRPHPEFRVFLTVDPRYGELSRAMRNRAVEIHLNEPMPPSDDAARRMAPVEGSLQRLSTVVSIIQDEVPAGAKKDLMPVVLEHLRGTDLKMLPRLIQTLEGGHLASSQWASPQLKRFLDFINAKSTREVRSQISGLYSTLPSSIAPGISKFQPIGPITNAPLVPVLSQTRAALPFWLARCFDFLGQLHALDTAVRKQDPGGKTQNMSSLNRLQRSYVSHRNSGATASIAAKDSTAGVSKFLEAVVGSFRDTLTLVPVIIDQHENWKDTTWSLQLLLRHLDRTFRLVTQNVTAFDEALFHAHLLHGKSMTRRTRDMNGLGQDEQRLGRLIETFHRALNKDFDSSFSLTTGQSMEQLWVVFRPISVPQLSVLQRSLQIVALAKRFDKLRWKARSPVADMASAVSTLSTAFGFVRQGTEDTTMLVRDIEAEMLKLEVRIGLESTETLPYFAREFDALRQTLVLRDIGSDAESSRFHDLTVLSDMPTTAELNVQVANGSARYLQLVDFLACQDADAFAWNGMLVPNLLMKVDRIGITPLSALELLEMELPQLGSHLSQQSRAVISGPYRGLAELLRQLLHETISAHDTTLAKALSQLCDQACQELALSSQAPTVEDRSSWYPDGLVDRLPEMQLDHLRAVVAEHLLGSWCALHASSRTSADVPKFMALAWIQFSLGAMKLYVPNRILDPHLRQKVELDFHQELQIQLNDKLTTLSELERRFTGQSSSLHLELTQEELKRLDDLPHTATQVYRPERSELGDIHTSFINVLKAIVNSRALAGSLHTVSEDDMAVVLSNTRRLIERLSGSFEAYQDMIRPVANMLRCLQLGLSLLSPQSSMSSDSRNLLKVMPFLGGTRVSSQTRFSPASFESMDYMSLAVAVVGLDNLEANHRRTIFDSFYGFYAEWSKKLEADKKEEAAKQSLYRFKGSYEDEEEMDEEELNELFPVYDDDDDDEENPADTKASAKQYRVRDMSLKVAEMHRRLLGDPVEPLSAMRDVLLSIARKVAGELGHQKSADPVESGRLFPATQLLLDEKLSKLKGDAPPSTYNFYVDANLKESRQLVQTVLAIKTRFRELQLVDEIGHLQPLADVQASCEKVLELVHTEPLAKLLPRVEQLHANMNAWQTGGFASRVHSAPELYDRLTATITQWRRLELSTWAKLFETEARRCRDDTDAWWFVAYQATVASPATLAENGGSAEELREYATSLLGVLETYFSSSILGQFSARLGLLRQLHRHLRLRATDQPALASVADAVGNFASFYQRFQKPVDEAIARGRSPLEKKMRDVLLITSWKDTNIEALRDSARSSHRKLFRLVRKFRGVLGQPTRQIIEQGLPDEEHGNVFVFTSLSACPIDSATLSLADNEMVDWLKKRGRLTEVQANVQTMYQSGKIVVRAEDHVKDVESFTSNLAGSVQELRKETPPFLTDDNKDQIKHIKTRKRKLFADVLRQSRQMGFEYNLDTTRLTRQESAQVILAETGAPLSPWLKTNGGACAEYHYHKLMDLMPRVRRAANEHSEDLTGREVARSIGLLEGMLHVTVAQRTCLADAGLLSTMERAVDQLRNLSKVAASGSPRFDAAAGDVGKALKWLVEIIPFAIHLVNVQTRLSQGDNAFCIDKLNSWLVTLRGECDADQQRQRRLPVGFMEDVNSQERIATALSALVIDIRSMASQFPSLEFILVEILNWTALPIVPDTATTTTFSIHDFAAQLSQFSDQTVTCADHLGNLATQDSLSHVGSSDRLLSSARYLDLRQASTQILKCANLLHGANLEDANVKRSVSALLAMFVPVADQYTKTCRHVYLNILGLHAATSQFAHCMAKNFAHLASQGFCTPQEKSDETSGADGKLESGTGLGEGEGAEDISKDIQPDEDLSELAQEPNKEKSGEIEDEKDAVDMADEEMEGEMGSVAADEDEDDQKSKDGDDEKDEMDEEAGDVDDLDATAKDEKTWEDDGKDAEKDQQGEKPQGKQQQDEKMAAEADQTSDQQDEGQEPEAVEPDEDEEGEDDRPEEPLNRQDQNVDQTEVLDLPEDMDLNMEDEDGQSENSDNLDDLSDLDDKDGNEDAEELEPNKRANDDDEEDTSDVQAAEQKEEDGEDREDGEMAEDEDANMAQEPDDEPQEEPKDGDEEEKRIDQRTDDPVNSEAQDVAPSDVRSSGQDQNQAEDDAMDLDDEFRHTTAHEEKHGEAAEGADNEDLQTGGQGQESNEVDAAQQKPDQEAEKERSEPFKKLGNALEKWHKQRAEIKEASSKEDAEQDAKDHDAQDVEAREFQHVQNDDEAGETQATGGATEEEAQPFNDAMDVDDDEEEDPSSKVVPGPQEDKEQENANMDIAEADKAEGKPEEPSATGALIKQGTLDDDMADPSSPAHDNQGDRPEEEDADEEDEDEESDIVEQLDTTHLDEDAAAAAPLRPLDECVQDWITYQNKTQALSQSLTSQLRLILNPSQSTKLSGTFRTGKRLNIKRIIPYIASGYKRDKIWMRRAVPTKRAYQVLLCLDDSASMGHIDRDRRQQQQQQQGGDNGPVLSSSSGSPGEMAAESLVMVARALAGLESGQVGVVGFGRDVFVAHDLLADTPLAASPAAGGRALQQFSFAQGSTEVELLVRRAMGMFRDARVRGAAPSADLWQLAIILSDGVCQRATHEPIRRLLREALEERIMFVFVVIDRPTTKGGGERASIVNLLAQVPYDDDDDDDVGGGPSSSTSNNNEMKKEKGSTGGKWRIERYLDSFPFGAYVIVKEVEALPGALSEVLRWWFAEVNA